MAFLVSALILLVLPISSLAAESVQTQAAETRSGGLSVWDGVYTAVQADRGKDRYEASCGSCHADDLSGGSGRSLKGDAFMLDWGGDDLNNLFGRTKATMPRNAPASLTDDAYIEIIAYILKANGFPAGADELHTAALDSIMIEGKDGPEPVPNFALAQVVGCLAQGPRNSWVLMDAGEPVRTRNPEASRAEEFRSLEAWPLGQQTYLLLNVFPGPDAYENHKVEVKGFLIKGPDEDRLNVTSLQSISPACSK